MEIPRFYTGHTSITKIFAVFSWKEVPAWIKNKLFTCFKTILIIPSNGESDVSGECLQWKYKLSAVEESVSCPFTLFQAYLFSKM